MFRNLLLCAGLLAMLPVRAPARFLRLPKFQTQRSASLSLRKRLHVNTLITEPGTVEIDWSSLYSFSSSNFGMPSAVKYTPVGSTLLWGRTEYSVAFDSLDNTRVGGGRLTQFSQSISATATTVLFDGAHLDIALAPQATFFIRDEAGARLGAVLIARYDFGRNSVGATLSWSGATHASDTNPAGTADIGASFGRRLAAGGTLGRFTGHANVVWERSSGVGWVMSVFEGVEVQLTDRFAIDVSGQHFSVRGGPADHQALIGVTVNLGHPH